MKIDAEGIGQRILALPVPARNYENMLAGETGVLFLAEAPLVVRESDSQNLKVTLQRFDLSKRKVEKFLDEANDFTVSFDGKKMLYQRESSGRSREPRSRRRPTANPSPARGR